jgi:tripartite-type tricarboxylate transporter receptor subunit TctC
MTKLLVALALAATGAVGGAAAQDFPSRHVTIIVPLAPGGSTDTIGRIIAEGMRVPLGQTVIVENSPGAGGSTGVIRAARSAPDGYTVQIGQWGTNVASGAVHDLPIDLLKDLEPVGLIATQPSMITGRKDLPPNNLKELITWLKEVPGRATFVTPASAARVTCRRCFCRTPSAASSGSCRIAAPARPRRTCSPATSI